MTVGETGNIKGLQTTGQTTGGTGTTPAFDSKEYNLRTKSIFAQGDTNKTGENSFGNDPFEENSETSKESLLALFKDFLKWNFTGGVLKNLAEGDVGSVIDNFKKETGLSGSDLALDTISNGFGAFKIAANAFKDDAEAAYNDENGEDGGFGAVSTNLDFES